MKNLDIGSSIYHIRSVKNVSQRELSSKTGVSHSYISHIENGTRDPSLNVLERISEALDVPVHVLLMVAADPITIDPDNQDSFQKIIKKWLKI